MEEFPHLLPKTAEKLSLSDEERIIEIGCERWIGYPKAQEVLQRFDDILKHPRVSRMPNAMLIGRTNNGKTDLVKRFCKSHLPQMPENGGRLNAPVMFIQAPPSPNESDLYVAILTTLYERVPTSSTAAKRARVLHILREIGLKVLFIDELHNSLAGSTTKRQQFLNALKFLGNELQISIIASGTEDLLRAVAIDNQIQNRFATILLPRWKYDRQFKQLLMTFERLLPLHQPSKLHEGLLGKKIFALSEGAIGEVSNLLDAASIYAIRHKTECITTEVLDNCSFQVPSERSSQISNLI